MAKELNFDSKKLLNKKFKAVDKGYDPSEVDNYLDKIIEDYQIIESRLATPCEDVDSLKAQISELKKTVSQLTSELEREQKKWKYMPKDVKEVHIDNYELLQRIGKLEMFIYEKLNLNPDEIK